MSLGSLDFIRMRVFQILLKYCLCNMILPNNFIFVCPIAHRIIDFLIYLIKFPFSPQNIVTREEPRNSISARTSANDRT